MSESKKYPSATDFPTAPSSFETAPPPYSNNTYTTGVTMVPVTCALPLGPNPTSITCPNCHSQILTRTERQHSGMQHAGCFLMFLFGLWCCCCLPYCVDSLDLVEHFCPSCNAYLGKYSR